MVSKIVLSCLLFLSLILVSPKVSADIEMPLQVSVSPKVYSSSVFNRIALCESGNNAHAKNKYSSASGRFQFLWSTWNHYGKELWGELFYEKNIFTYEDNTELAWYVYTKYGTGDWNESKSCWQ